MHALRSASTSFGDLGDFLFAAVATHQQIAVALTEFLQASAKGVASFFGLVHRVTLEGLGNQQVDIVAEIELLTASAAKEVRHLEASYPTCPRKETSLAVELGKLVPQNHGRLLEQIVGIVEVSYKRINKAIKSPLILLEQLSKLGMGDVRRHRKGIVQTGKSVTQKKGKGLFSSEQNDFYENEKSEDADRKRHPPE